MSGGVSELSAIMHSEGLGHCGCCQVFAVDGDHQVMISSPQKLLRALLQAFNAA